MDSRLQRIVYATRPDAVDLAELHRTWGQMVVAEPEIADSTLAQLDFRRASVEAMLVLLRTAYPSRSWLYAWNSALEAAAAELYRRERDVRALLRGLTD